MQLIVLSGSMISARIDRRPRDQLNRKRIVGDFVT